MFELAAIIFPMDNSAVFISKVDLLRSVISSFLFLSLAPSHETLNIGQQRLELPFFNTVQKIGVLNRLYENIDG